MSFVKIAILIITLNFLEFCALAEYSRFAVEKRGDTERVRVCGSELPERLADVCGGIYNKKRDHGRKYLFF